MTFYGLDFFVFLPVVALLYWLLPRRANVQNAFLLLVSYLFYLSWSPKLLPLFLVSTAIDYVVAIRIEGHRPKDDGSPMPRAARLLLAASLLTNFGALALFKYAGFFATSLNGLLTAAGGPNALPVLRLALPIGISFWTLQKAAYVLDVYYGKIPACRSKVEFATFVAFFPKMMAGPIVRAEELLPQLAVPRKFDTAFLTRGVGVYFLGFIQKAWVADFLAERVVNRVFARPDEYARGSHWLAFFGYAAQVFCDFSGYSLMAIGTGRLFGLELPSNFNYPFLSKNLTEFWRRWHITLNTWLFDYIYGPLVTGTGWFRDRLDMGFLLVFVISGLWHGPSFTFVTWGLLHGIGLVVYRRWDQFYRSLSRKDKSTLPSARPSLTGQRRGRLRRGSSCSRCALFAPLLFSRLPWFSGASSYRATATFGC